MKNTIKAYYVDPITNTAEAREITDALDTYYELLHCDCIDIVERGFGVGRRGKRRFNIVCDDEGLFKDDVRISAIDDLGRTMIVGALLVTGRSDDEGNLTSLTDDDVRVLERYTMHMSTRKHPKGYKMLTQMTY